MRSTLVVLLSLLAVLSASVAQAQAIPPSPYGKASKICPSRDRAYDVEKYPGSPFVLKPFTNVFKNPPQLAPKLPVSCRDDGHCIASYEIEITDIQAKPFDTVAPACKAKPGTWFMTYNRMVPGPTIVATSGFESIVRFTNNIRNKFNATVEPCGANGRAGGRPISVHLHGAESLAVYDGWAEDQTCVGETKEYVYPNDTPKFLWYHDHSLHITTENAYHGLSGMYISSSKVKDGGCGEPYSLEDIEALNMQLSDAVLDRNCQLLNDEKAHDDNLYGDINMVSGIPFPVMNLMPKWYRTRILNSAISRPYLVKIKDAQLRDVAQDMCHLFASGAGFRNEPFPFPAQGLFMSSAERYELACDFSRFAGQTLYIWNEQNEKEMKGVPFFCFSHLIAKVVVAAQVTGPAPAFNPAITTPWPNQPLYRVLSEADFEEARRRANNDEYDRSFDFGRSGGQWSINGETWDSFKIAADDVGQGTAELWKFKSGGGWHPIHMHLVDMFIMRRDGGEGRDYEDMMPKDTFFLGPGYEVWVLIRFGAHRGDYMFHCHNIVHEDDMMRAMTLVQGQQGLTAPTAEPEFITINDIVYSNFKYANPLLGETAARPTANWPQLDTTYQATTLTKSLYRIFYPNTTDPAVLKSETTNPWLSQWKGKCRG